MTKKEWTMFTEGFNSNYAEVSNDMFDLASVDTAKLKELYDMFETRTEVLENQEQKDLWDSISNEVNAEITKRI